MREFLLTALCALMVVGVTVMSLDRCSDAQADVTVLEANPPRLRNTANLELLTADVIDASQADVDGSGEINVLDLLKVAQHSGTPVPENPCAIFDRSGESGHPVFIVIPQEQIDLLASGALRVVRECQ